MILAKAVECVGYDICTQPAGNWAAVIAGFVVIWALWRWIP